MLIDLKKVTLKVPTDNGTERVLLKIENFKIEPNQKILIQGPSGTGKSSLLHFIAGLMGSSEGHLHWDGKRVGSLSDHERSQIRKQKFAIIFQRLNLLDHLSLRENIFLALDRRLNQTEKSTRADQALASVDLSSRANDLAAVLSLGEQQRLAIARALAQKPEVILADEPTSSLDKKNADTCMKALLQAAQNASLVVVSHDERIQKSFSQVKSIMDWVP